MKITEAEYKTLLTRLAAFEAWRNGRTSYKTEDVPAGLEVSNEDRTKIEIYEFVNNPPNRYFAYVKRLETNTRTARITTWTGELLGVATLGQAYETPAFGRTSKRVPVLKFKAINGKSYYGTFFESSGDYCRLKMAASH